MSTGRNETMPRDPVARLLVGLLGLIGGLILTFLLALVIQLASLTWWWPEQGVERSRTLLNDEMAYLSTEFTDSLVTAEPALFAHALLGQAQHYLLESTGLMDGLDWLGKRLTAPRVGDSALNAAIHRGFAFAGDYLTALMVGVQLFFLRVSVLLLSMPVFVLFGAVGLADGLAKRDLRRWGGGRESGFIYHHAKRLVMPCFFVLWITYLCMPWSVNPGLMVVPFAALFGLALAVSAATFKKYL